MNSTTKYLATSTTGKTKWADGELSARCWLREAKYHGRTRKLLDANILDDLLDAPPKPDGPTIKAIPGTTYIGMDSTFAGYGDVCNFPASPAKECWDIGLEVTVSRPGYSLWIYVQKMIRYNIHGMVIYKPTPSGG